jgi:hypothetical protein
MTKHHQRDQGRNLFWIPEQFVWYVFECLCIAGLLLERSTQRETLLPLSRAQARGLWACDLLT